MRWLVLLAVTACAHREPAPRPAVQWTDAQGNPLPDQSRTTDSMRYREARRQQPASEPAPPLRDPFGPTLRCNDGASVTGCGPHGEKRSCCQNQGGLARDRWGNLIYE